MPNPTVVDDLFAVFDKDNNGKIDYLEMLTGACMLCGGSEEEKLEGAFSAFDEDGDGFVSLDEMLKFLTAVFRVVLTPQVASTMRSLGVRADGAEDLATSTAIDCFEWADTDRDGRLSFEEFKRWFHAPAKASLL